MSNRRLSVALPVRNGGNFLAAALESILAQDFGDFVLVVSDNASTDATADILADFGRRDGRVRSSRTSELIPQAANMNRAVALAPGDWVKLFCHDDLMSPDCLTEIDAVLDRAEAGNVGLIGNSEHHLFDNGYLTEGMIPASPRWLSGRDTIVKTLRGNYTTFALPAVTTATVRKAAFDQAGRFDDRYTYFDTFCWLELLTRWDFVFLPMALTTNRIHGGQVAARARASLRAVQDFRTFMPDYLDRHGCSLQLPRTVQWRARMRPLGEAATAIAVEAINRRWASAARMVRQLPPHWMPVMLPLALRAWRRQRAGTAELGTHVPLSMLFP